MIQKGARGLKSEQNKVSTAKLSKAETEKVGHIKRHAFPTNLAHSTTLTPSDQPRTALPCLIQYP